MTLRELRGQMAAHGVTQEQLAEAAEMARPDISNLFHGRLWLGPTRLARLEQVIERLGLDRPAPDEPLPPTKAREPIVFRIRAVSSESSQNE